MKLDEYIEKNPKILKLATKEELKKDYEKFYEEMKQRGVLAEKLEDYAVGRLHSYYKKMLLNPVEEFEAVVIGIDKATDFGAKKKFDNVRQMWEKGDEDIRRVMVSAKEITSDGIPLWDKPEFRAGKPIDPEREKRRSILLLAKKADDANYKLAKLSLSGKAIDNVPELFSKVKFVANVGQKSDEQCYYLFSIDNTEFKTIGKETDVIGLISKNLRQYCTKPSDLKEYLGSETTKLAILKANINQISLGTPPQSHRVIIDSDLMLSEASITCWVPQEIKIDFEETAQDAIIIGNVSITHTLEGNEKLSVNAVGLWVAEAFRKKVEPEKLGETEKEVTQPLGKEIKDSFEDW